MDNLSSLMVVKLNAMGGQGTSNDLREACQGLIPDFNKELLKCLDSHIFTAHICSSSSKLVPPGRSSWLLQQKPPQNIYLKLSEPVADKLVATTKKPQEVLRAVAAATDRRRFNSNYQAVVSGKKARKDPIQTHIKTLNPQDQSDAWRAVSRLDDDEQEALRARLRSASH